MARARAHIPEEPSEAQPAASAAQGLSAPALRNWLSTVIPANNAPRTANAADEAPRAQHTGAAEMPAAGRPVFPDPPRSNEDARLPLEPDHDLEQLCDRLDTLTRQLARLVTRMDAGQSADAAADAADDPVEVAIAEIFARQRVLAEAEPDGPTMFPPAVSAPVVDPATDAAQTPAVGSAFDHGSALDLGGLEQQLKLITKQLEILRSPCRAEELIAELRQELAGIAATLDILVPRSAFDALEQEVHVLSDRLDSTRDASTDTASLAKLEQGLAEIRDAISNLAPIELGEAVQTLSYKVDQISSAGMDPLTLQQLDAATNSLRSIVTQVASGDALAALVNEVRELGEKIDRNLPSVSAVAPASLDHDLLLALEREVSGIAATINAKADQVPAPAIEPLIDSIVHKLDRFDLLANDETMFAPIKAHISELGDKIDRLQPPQADPAAFAPLETQLGHLTEKIEHLQSPQADSAAFAPLEALIGHLTDTIERLNVQGIDQPTLAALDERMRAIAMKLDRLEETAPARVDIGPLEQRIAELGEKLGASEARLGNLEAIEHGMTELIARLDEIRKAAGIDAQPAAPPPGLFGAIEPAAGQAVEPASQALEPDRQTSAAEPQAFEPETPQGSSLDDFFAGGSAGDEARVPADHGPEHGVAEPWLGSSPLIEPVRSAEPADFAAPAETMEPAQPAAPNLIEAPAGMLNLPPDAPIEPGAGPPRFRASRSTAERIAASQAMLGPLPADRAGESGARPNFIIAARRAAQAASEQHGQAAVGAAAGDVASGSVRKALAKRVRSLFIPGSVIVLALGATGIMLSFTDLRSSHRDQAIKLAAAPATKIVAPQQRVATAAVAPAKLTASRVPAMSPAVRDAKAATDTAAPIARAAAEEKRHTGRMAALASADTTGSIGLPRATRLQSVPAAQPVEASKGKPWSDPLPPALKTKPLVAGVGAHNPGAAYEIALRYAEGRGTDVDMAAAATWLARAAEGGIVPAQFRLGSMYEKGVGVKKDREQARRYYLAAANHGNAHAMHNLAVLYAEGADGKPDFAAAVKWFRKAAEYGVADSQYNAAVLLARGIGVEQNLGEAYKWFAVAAKGGDKDATKKRDEIGERLDAQTLAAARLAASIFVPTPQPAEATTVGAPATGWDDVAILPPKPRPRAHRPGARSARL